MCCFFAILATIVPRLALLLLWVATPLVVRAFDSFLVPLIGLIFLPFTTVVYVLVYSPVYGVSVFGWFLVILALFIDLGSWGGGYAARNRTPNRSL
ncbi:MAG TPA: hypothetical protein VHS06_11590 [Chloroflexota bacterium]|nr:hypothetical protein [Chloroflexota bacterium]